MEALHLAVRLGPPEGSAPVVDVQVSQRPLEGMREAIGEGVVGHQPLKANSVGGEEVRGSAQEARTGGTAFVRQHLAVGQAGVVIDEGMDVVVALARVRAPQAAAKAMAAARGIRPSFLTSIWPS